MSARAIVRRLLVFLRPYVWPQFGGALACMIAYSAMSGAVPWLVRSLIDDVFAARDERMLSMLPALIAAVFAVRAAVNFGQSYLGEWVGESIVYDLRGQLQDAAIVDVVEHGRGPARVFLGLRWKRLFSSRVPLYMASLAGAERVSCRPVRARPGFVARDEPCELGMRRPAPLC